MVNIYKSGISALQFSVENGNILSDGDSAFVIKAARNCDLRLSTDSGELSLLADGLVHIPGAIRVDTADVQTLEVDTIQAEEQVSTSQLTADTIETNIITANNAILYHPLLDDGSILDTSTVISVHASVFNLYSAIKELKDATNVEYNTVRATTTLLSPGILDGQRTGVIRNIASVSAETLSTTSATVTDLTAVNISGVDGFEAAQVSADTGVFGNINAANTVTAGTVNAATAVSTATVTATNATIPNLTTTTLRPVSNAAGVVISGADAYSYLTLNSTGAMVTDTKSVKVVARTLDGKTAGITMTGEGVTLQENMIIIPNAVSVIHSLMTGDITSDPDYNALREEVTQLSEDFATAIEDSEYPTLPEVPSNEGAWEAVRLTSDYLPLEERINAISIDALNTNANAPRFLSVYVKLTGNATLQLLGVSDEAVTWTAGEKVTWNFLNSFTFPATTEYVEINLIASNLSPSTVNNSAKIKSNYLEVTTGGNGNAQRYDTVWYSGRATFLTFEQKGTLGKLNAQVEEATSNVAVLQAEVADLELTTQSDIVALQLDLSTLQEEVTDLEATTQSDITALQQDLSNLQEEVDNIEISGGASSTSISTEAIYGSNSTLFVSADYVAFTEPRDGDAYKNTVCVDTSLNYISIHGQDAQLDSVLSSRTPVTGAVVYDNSGFYDPAWKHSVPTIHQISQNLLDGALGSVVTRPVVFNPGIEDYNLHADGTIVFEYCAPNSTLYYNITKPIHLSEHSFINEYSTSALYYLGTRRMYDMEVLFSFSSAAIANSDEMVFLRPSIQYAMSVVNGTTPITGLLYHKNIRVYSGTISDVPGIGLVLRDNYVLYNE